jgi:hypothetical protein
VRLGIIRGGGPSARRNKGEYKLVYIVKYNRKNEIRRQYFF